MSETSFNSEYTINSFVKLINDFKKSLYNVNYVNKLIDQHKDEIIAAQQKYINDPTFVGNGYSDIIRPYMDKKYINFTNNTNDNNGRVNLFIEKIVLNDWESGFQYYSSSIPMQENKLFSDDYWKSYIPTSTDFYLVDGAEQNLYNIIKSTGISKNNYLNSMLKINPNLTSVYQFDVRETPSGLVIVIRLLRKDILSNDWLNICDSVKIFPYFNNANTIKNISFINEIVKLISNLLFQLESTQWNNTDLVKEIWEFNNTSFVNGLTCLKSYEYPNWTGKNITDCYIPNSNIYLSESLNQLFTDLYLYYPSLSEGELAFSTYNINGNNVISICKVDTFQGKTCVKEVKLDLNSYVTKNNILGDTIITGNIKIIDTNPDNNNIKILETDNQKQVTSIYTKVGINQQLHEVEGFLDIDNLSKSKILDVVDNIAVLNNTTYNVVEEIQTDISNNVPFTISPDYVNDVVVFKVPILNKISETDIQFLYKPSNILKTKFAKDSFLKIQLIVNEINRMETEINNYQTQEGKKLVMSFVELLNDREYYYVCSLKAMFQNNEIYFVMSYLLVQDIMLDKSYTQLFTKLINGFSSSNRLLNYSILVVELPEIYAALQKGDSVNSFTNYIQNSEFSNRFGMLSDPYVFCIQYFAGNKLDGSEDKYLFAENYPQWNGQFLKNVFLPGTDILLTNVSIKSLTYYQNKYGLYKNSQNFITHYLFEEGEKVSFYNKIMIKGKEYVIGTGIHLSNYIDLSILSSGDNQLSGNLYLKDIDNKNVFGVDTQYKKIVNMYSTGIGTEYPNTILDVKDSGLTEILNIIRDLAYKSHGLNLNTYLIKNLPVFDASNVDYTINKYFIDPYGEVGKGYSQNKDNYYALGLAPMNDNPNNFMNIYTWLYRNWDNTKYANINDKNNKNIINHVIDAQLNSYKTQYMIENFQIINTIDWTYGKKIVQSRVIKNNSNVELYTLRNGTNIGSYDLKYNNNSNTSLFFDYIKYMNLYLQDFLIRYKNINTTTISNYKSVSDTYKIISETIPVSQFGLKKIVVDFQNFTSNIKIYDIDFNTQVVSGNDSNQTIYELLDTNVRSKYLIMITNIIQIYAKNNPNKQIFNKDDYGIINLEDNYVDFMSLFYCSDVTFDLSNNPISVSLISLELQLNSVIQPSVDIKGDVRISGDTYFYNSNTGTDFVSIDTDQSFFGIGTNQRYANYNLKMTTFTNYRLSQQHFIVSGSSFPVSVIERFSEIEPIRDPSSNQIIVPNPDTQGNSFTPKVGQVNRRSSNYFTIKEMYDNSNRWTSNIINGPYATPEGIYQQSFKYGVASSFEIQDSTNIIFQLGNMGMGLDNVDNNGLPETGFYIAFNDFTPDGIGGTRVPLYLNNDGVLNVDQIKLGMNPIDPSNNILLSASNEDLKINNKPLQNIINDNIQTTLSSSSGINVKSLKVNDVSLNTIINNEIQTTLSDINGVNVNGINLKDQADEYGTTLLLNNIFSRLYINGTMLEDIIKSEIEKQFQARFYRTNNNTELHFKDYENVPNIENNYYDFQIGIGDGTLSGAPGVSPD